MENSLNQLKIAWKKWWCSWFFFIISYINCQNWAILRKNGQILTWVLSQNLPNLKHILLERASNLGIENQISRGRLSDYSVTCCRIPCYLFAFCLSEEQNDGRRRENDSKLIICFSHFFIQVIQALVSLINEPEPDHPLRGDLAEEYMKDRKKFMKNAEEFTKKHSERRPAD